MYEKIEFGGTGTLQLGIPAIKEWTTKMFKEAFGVHLPSPEDDFFAAGVNSLQATQMRGLILRDLDIGGNSGKLGLNVIFDTGNVARLAEHLCAVKLGGVAPEDDEDEIEVMEAMVKIYSTDPTFSIFIVW